MATRERKRLTTGIVDLGQVAGLHIGKNKKPRPKPLMNIINACEDRNLFQPWFRERQLWTPWFAFLKAVFGIPMNKAERKIYQYCTKRTDEPSGNFEEIWLVIGRRGGKSRMLALIAVFLACFMDWRPFLSPGERANVVIIATDRKQARIIFRYIEAFLKNVPMLSRYIEREYTEVFELENQVAIEIHTASFKGVRGYTVIAALCDEIAFWRSEESVNPDAEILNALKPGMLTIPGAMLLGASSPYAQKGVLYEAYDNHFGVNDDKVLVWQAHTRIMNPSADEDFIKQQYRKDYAKASAEYGAIFRKDVQTLFDKETVDGVIPRGVRERPYLSEYDYKAFVDPSGGSQDSMTLAISHSENGKPILDLIREVRPPFSPEDVVSDFVVDMKRYHVSRVVGDRYGGEWPREQFRKRDIWYELSDKTKSDIYREAVPLLNSGDCELLDDALLKNQIISLERRVARGGKDSIDHPPGGHDDVANAALGAICLAKVYDPVEIW